MEYFDYCLEDFIPCECCGNRAVDIHHINCRGMGGGKEADKIDNLMALCRACHVEYGDKVHYTEWLQDIHNELLR